MVERIEEMPAGTIGFKVVEELTGADYRERIEPALTEAAESGEVRLLFEIDSGFGMDAGLDEGGGLEEDVASQGAGPAGCTPGGRQGSTGLRKVVVRVGMVPPLSGHHDRCQRQRCV